MTIWSYSEGWRTGKKRMDWTTATRKDPMDPTKDFWIRLFRFQAVGNSDRPLKSHVWLEAFVARVGRKGLADRQAPGDLDARDQGEDPSPQSAIKSFFLIALICTTRSQIPASASTNHGPEKGDLILI